MNANSIQLILYHTAGCHLCDEARQLLAHIPSVAVTETDIAEDPLLIEYYGTRIPVLLRPDTGSTLDWPFTTETIIRLINLSQR